MSTENAAPEESAGAAQESAAAALPKAYDPKLVEDAIYARWEASGLFNPDNLPDLEGGKKRSEPFTIMMPPPNRTGILHVGHATGNALQDLMIRFNRMRGKRALWLPGTDHAAIATQVKVEGILREQGMKNPRRELGREKFLEEVVKFAADSGKTIVMQTRKMGASCDWSREAYTFDDARNRAVNRLFEMMHEDGLIERGDRIVNWDPKFQTTLSDDEVEMKETVARFLTFKYDRDFPIVISSTRPETKFGDTAVAVHPDDARYAAFVGKTFTPTFCGQKLTVRVIADREVDPEFGTGALGVTPAHSMIDADMAARQSPVLPTVQVIGTDGCMNDAVPEEYRGLTVKEARVKIEAALQAAGLLIAVEEIKQNLPVAERGGMPVEQLPMKQWFVRANKEFTLRQDTLGMWKKGERTTLKDLMREAVQSGQVKIMPEQFEKVYFHWIDNLRDWCISRQIWFGHRVPAWHRGEEIVVGAEKPSGDGWEQDPDTLDTWFSSGSWTFSTLGWPDKYAGGVKEGDLAKFHPTDVLETGRDILFFWIARMILMSTYALGEVPFKTAYLHGLVRDEQGRKMSKSLGNIIDPLVVSEKFGTDAVRLSLVLGNSPGNDMRISEEKIGYFRNFTNKLWNIARFVMMSAPGLARPSGRPEPKTLADRWILARLDATIASVSDDLEKLVLSRPGETLRDFTWNDLADWYLEIAKIEGGKDEMLSYVLSAVLKLWHPFMPFVTEEIWAHTFAAGKDDFLMVAEWPVATGAVADESDAKRFTKLQEIVTTIRNLRSTHKVEPGKRVDTYVFCGSDDAFIAEGELKIIATLAKAGQIHAAACGKSEGMPRPQHAASGMAGTTEVLISLEGLVDPAAEKARLQKEYDEAAKYVEVQSRKLDNADFVARAPEKVIALERQKLADAKEKAEKLTAQLDALK
ncbi:MAG: valyl-tRNA synthetase, valyl-tRNA synthetase [Candidatus Parcubacteria bacterium]|jgi:valyl-tRNA synthetase